MINKNCLSILSNVPYIVTSEFKFVYCHKIQCTCMCPVISLVLILYEHCMYIMKPILTLLHSERPKLHTILAFLSAIGLKHDANCDVIGVCPYTYYWLVSAPDNKG